MARALSALIAAVTATPSPRETRGLWLLQITPKGLDDLASCYDCYNMAVVVAHDEEQARTIHPGGRERFTFGQWREDGYNTDTWVSNPTGGMISATRLGDASPDLYRKTGCGVVCASFNAG